MSEQQQAIEIVDVDESNEEMCGMPSPPLRPATVAREETTATPTPLDDVATPTTVQLTLTDSGSGNMLKDKPQNNQLCVNEGDIEVHEVLSGDNFAAATTPQVASPQRGPSEEEREIIVSSSTKKQQHRLGHPLHIATPTSRSPVGFHPATPSTTTTLKQRGTSPSSSTFPGSPLSSGYYIHKTVIREDPNTKRFEADEFIIHEGDVVMFEWTSMHNILQIEDLFTVVEPISCPPAVGATPLTLASGQHSAAFSRASPSLANGSFGSPATQQLFNSNESFGHYTADGKRRSGDPIACGRFTCSFDKAGTFYFCSETTPEMRVTIRVETRPISESGMLLAIKTALVLFIGGGVFSALVTMLVLWSQQHATVGMDTGGDDPTLKELQDAFLQHSYPWFVCGVMTAAILIIAGLLVQFRRSKLTDYGRGFDAFAHSVAAMIFFFILCVLLALMFGVWYTTLLAGDGWGKLATTLSDSIIVAINDVVKTMNDVVFLDRELPVFLPGFQSNTGSGSAQDTIEQVETIAEDVKYYSALGESTLRGGIRLLSAFHFFSLQVVIVAVAFGWVASMQRKARLAKAASWTAWIAVAAVCFSIGITTLLYHVVKITHDTADTFNKREYTVAELLRQDEDTVDGNKDSVLVRALSLCTSDRDEFSFSFVEDSMNQGIDILNEQLNATNASLGAAGTFAKPLAGKLTSSQLSNFTHHLSTQLDIVEIMLADQNVSSPTNGSISAIPALRAIISVQKSLLRIVDCTMLRGIIASSIPVMDKDILGATELQLRLMRTMFSFTVITGVVAAAVAIVFARPFKVYCESTTRRYFIFGYSLKVCQRVLKHNAKKMRPFIDYWNPHTWTQHNILSATNELSVTTAATIAAQAGLLVIVYYRTVSEDDSIRKRNNLDPKLLTALVMCFLLPIISIPIAVSRQRPAVHIALRAIVVIFAACTVCTIAIFSWRNSVEAQDCIQEIEKKRNDLNVTKTVEDVRSDDCNANEIAFRYEMGTYVLFVGLTNLVAVICGVILLVFHRRVVTQPVYIPGVSTAKMLLRKAVRFLTTKNGMIVLSIICGVLLVAIVVVIVLIIFLAKDPEKQCNGSAGNCKRRLNEMAWGCTHNSMSSSADRFIAANHYFGIKYQLEHGVRSLMLDVWEHEGEAYLCHTYCALGRTPLKTGLQQVYDFLEHNPREVIIIIFEQYVPHALITGAMDSLEKDWYPNEQNITLLGNASDDSQLAGLRTPMDWVWSVPQTLGGYMPGPQPPETTRSASRTVTMSLSPTFHNETMGNQTVPYFGRYNDNIPSRNESFMWPTIEELLSMDKRLVFFTDEGDTARYREGATPPWLMYMWDYLYETHFSAEVPSDFSCGVLRGDSDNPNVLHRKMSILNHFLTFGGPVPSLASEVNSKAFVRDRIQECAEDWNANATRTSTSSSSAKEATALHNSAPPPPRLPNFISVDFWSIGGVEEGVEAANGYYQRVWGV